MLITRLDGGLGNQLFQYAAGRALTYKHGVELKYDDEACKKNPERPLKLNLYKLNASLASTEDVNEFKDPKKLKNRINNWLSSKFNWPYYKKRVVQEPHFHFSPDFFKIGREAYIQGWWQSEKYFKQIRKILLKEIVLNVEPDNENKKLLYKIQKVNSVSLHVRRGDYVKNPSTKAYHGNCSLEYYKEAIRIMDSKVKNTQYFIFSDDPEWTKHNLKIIGKAIYVTNNLEKEYEDLRLMQACKHNIIANSSFSWWGAWLGGDAKYVVAPKRWFLNSNNNYSDIIPHDWLKI